MKIKFPKIWILYYKGYYLSENRAAGFTRWTQHSHLATKYYDRKLAENTREKVMWSVPGMIVVQEFK